MPLLEPSEVVALGLSPKDIPAHKAHSPRKSLYGAGQVGSKSHATAGRVTTHTPHSRRRNLISTSLPTRGSSGRSTSGSSLSGSASPTVSSGFRSGFEVCIPIPSTSKLAVLQQYEKFPEADMATDGVSFALAVGDVPEEARGESIAEAQSELPAAENLDEANGSSGAGNADVDMNDKQSIVAELEVPIVPIVSDISL
ncbi:hypothetical protein TWF481_001039 [Arthrobotrys musiformis]|uniref:Uncharacterized protein n=1 Tax=Arthrobotrys musiformis TaxID=47236 RepID=A0AAV9WQH7_9PEZI